MTAKVHFLVVNQCAAAGLHPFRAAWGTPGVVDSRSETKAEVICFTSFGRKSRAQQCAAHAPWYSRDHDVAEYIGKRVSMRRNWAMPRSMSVRRSTNWSKSMITWLGPGRAVSRGGFSAEAEWRELSDSARWEQQSDMTPSGSRQGAGQHGG
ncbi:hypothetical protein IG631_06559 [Alternaria alternata]|nr:hypothetical protein IG631_06559 [Alternaria alternata]